MQQNSLSLDAALLLLREAYRKKEYKRALTLGRSVLRSAPESLEVREIVKEAEIFVTLRKGKILRTFGIMSFILVLGVIPILAYQWFILNPSYVSRLNDQNQKYMGIIKENGQLKESNSKLIGQTELFKSQISMLTSNVHRVADKMNRKREQRTDEKDILIKEMQEKIDEQDNQIQKLISLTVTQAKTQSAFTYANDIINFLILGTHGGLTDTILVASVNPSLRTITLLSIPRDLYIDGRKMNEIYRDFGQDTVGVYLHDITGLVIDHYVVVEFDGFIQLIDSLGGIDINIMKDIEDKNYPVGDGTVETFSLQAGWQHLDGSMALKYARTRHDDSDFERAKRQHQIVDTTLQKVNALGITDLGKMLEMGRLLLSYVKADFNIFQAMGFYQDYRDYRLETGNVISTANYLYSSRGVNDQYILLPNDNTYKEIQQYVYDLVMK